MPIHIVQKGDNLWKLSQEYGVSVNRIISANGIEEPGKLVLGEALFIPDAQPRYTVRPGDTLQAIANRYDVTVQSIMDTNQLKSPTSIYAGQRLTIPLLYHQVAEGETLTTIATSYNTTPQAIQAANQLSSPSDIFVSQMLKIPETPKPVIDVNGFLTQFGHQGARTLRELENSLTYASPFAHRMKADGSLGDLDDVPIVQTALRYGVLPMMAITNFSSTETGTELAHTILSSDALQNTLVENTVLMMKNKGYRGLNIDFENVLPQDKNNYNQFLQKAANRLHAEGYFVSSSLAPKTSADQKGLLYEAHDYPAHGRIMDFVVLMTYEWGYRFGPPQAISPIGQIRKVLEYAVSVIPQNKIMMGFQVYARDWTLPHVQGQQAETFDMQEAISRALEYNVAIQYDAKAQSPYYEYTDANGKSHEVWFEDARSAQAKFELVKSFGLRGISYWVIDYPFPQNWALLRDNFTIARK